MALLQLALSQLARSEGLASSVIANRAQLEAAVRAHPGSAEALAAAARLEGWRAELAGPPLYAVYSGERSIRVTEGSRVTIS